MNYGKESLSKKKKNVSSKKNMKKKRVGVRVFKAVVICFLLICIIGAAGGGLFVKKIIDDTPRSPADVKPSGYKSQVVAASTGQPLAQFRKPVPTVSIRPLTRLKASCQCLCCHRGRTFLRAQWNRSAGYLKSRSSGHHQREFL